MKLPARPASSFRSNAAAEAIVAAFAIGLLYFGRSVLIPITLAALLSFVLTPVASRLQRLGLGRAVAVLLVTLFGFLVVGVVVGVVGLQATSLVEDLPQYQAGLEQKVSALKSGAEDGPLMRNLSTLLGRLRGAPPTPRAQSAADRGAAAAPAAEAAAPVTAVVRPAAPTAYELAKTYLSPILEPVFTAGVVVTFLIFILMERETLRDRLIWLLGSGELRRTTKALDEVANRLSRYFLVQTSINFSLGVVIGAGLWVIGIPNFALWGALTFLLRFLPYVGVWIAAAMPLLLAAAIEPGWTKLIWTAGLYGTVELITGQVVEPFLFGRTTGMSPLAVVFAAAFWTSLWGPVGLLLSTP
jgi:predicted PurR-regulated permease PerM